MEWVKTVKEFKGQFKNEAECLRIAEIMDERTELKNELFGSWYSNWFIFFPVFLWKCFVYDKKIKALDTEFDSIISFLDKKERQ